ncbi:hypothetical protein CISG_00040 [Coccidioides immitis RMSCC 3703]|uniref:Uncharacterized protein n=1 Tax=Coccidioides immitis RMSCC 3703 TaxID=454286 RepID=A0A0J8QH33_COCIT|nr:hypothetical protein CISG_00040 [Coccidioides immitis RMSCC 3703]
MAQVQADTTMRVQLDKLCAFEHGGSTPELKPHTLLFIAGLSDGLGTVPFINDIAKALEPTKCCVAYVRRYKGDRGHDKPGMIALMGHSTGSQDVLHYLYSPNPLQAGSGLKRQPVDGAILQAPVSDRDSDLNDDRLLQTFGAIGSRGMLKGSLLVLPGEEDEYVPMWVNKEMLLERWENATKQGAGGRDIWDTTSGLVAGAFHSPSGRTQEEPRKELVSRVERYLNKMEKL